MGEESEYGCQQSGGIQRIRVVVLTQHAALIDAMSEDVVLDLGSGGPQVAARSRSPRISASFDARSRATHPISLEDT